VRKNRFVALVLAITLLGPGIAAATASLRGSKNSLSRQHTRAEKEDLSRIKNDRQLANMKRLGLLVPIPTSRYIQVDPRLDKKWRYVRPRVARFLLRKGKQSMAKFGIPLRVNSAVRTIEYQRQLQRRNPNATAPEKSSHTTGATIDLAKFAVVRGRRVYHKDQQEWLRRELHRLEREGFVEATEEHVSSCFHIMVFNNYP